MGRYSGWLADMGWWVIYWLLAASQQLLVIQRLHNHLTSNKKPELIGLGWGSFSGG